MRRVRQFHLYFGTLFAPAIIFFAFSGGLQTLGLHEPKRGVTPPAWIEVMANVHRDQTLERPPIPDWAKPPPRAPGAGGGPGPDPRISDDHDAGPPAGPDGHPGERERPPIPHVALKFFVVALALGLIATAVLGIVIALRNRATRRVSLVMLALGVVIPVTLLFL